MSSRDLTAETLREYLNYDPETGVFTRIKSTTRPGRVGAVAGAEDSRGHIQVRVLGKLYLAHRLVWLYVHGVWPTYQIDHINGVRSDNRLSNLREVSASVNQQNQRRPRSVNPYLGVTKRHDKWRARITVEGRLTQLGTFDTPEEARDAYLEAKRKLHAGCTI